MYRLRARAVREERLFLRQYVSIAYLEEHIDCVCLMLEKGEQVSYADTGMVSALNQARCNGHVFCVSLLQAEFKVSDGNADGNTALIHGFGLKYGQMLALLLI